MKRFLKKLRNSGMQSRILRTKVKFAAFAVCMLMLIGSATVSAMVESDSVGIENILLSAGGSVSFAVAAFAIPEKVKSQLSEKEVDSLNAVAKYLTDVVNEKIDGDIVKHLNDKIEEKSKELNLDKETVTKLQESIRKQGETLKGLKENGAGNIQSNRGGLKDAFFKNFDKFQKACRNKEEISIKAVDEHNPDLIITTGNVITGTGETFLTELNGERAGIVMKRRNRQFIRDIVNVTQVEKVDETYSFWEEGDEEGAIAIVEENELKPQVGLSLVKNVVDAQKAAGYIVVTEEVVKWRTRAWAAIQRLFRDKVMRDYTQILHDQLITNATPYPGTALDGTMDNPNDIDAIAAGMLVLESLNFIPDTLVINPADKYRLLLSTTSQGFYLFMPAINGNGEITLLGLNVITSNEVPAGTFYLGESGTWYIEEEAPQIRTGWVNDDFVHNRFTVVGEIFFLSYVPTNNAGAWLAGNFDDIKDALQV